MPTPKPTVQTADVTDEGVLIGFSDGTNILFGSDFLYDQRLHQGNRTFPTETEIGDRENYSKTK